MQAGEETQVFEATGTVEFAGDTYDSPASKLAAGKPASDTRLVQMQLRQKVSSLPSCPPRPAPLPHTTVPASLPPRGNVRIRVVNPQLLIK